VTYTGQIRPGQTGCEATEWESETSVSCLLSGRASSTRRLSITSGDQVYSLSLSWSVDIPAISATFGANVASTGSSRFTVFGIDFISWASTPRLVLSGSAAESSSWVSGTSLYCLSSVGSQVTNRLCVTSQRRQGSISQIFSFDLHLISSVTPPNSAAQGRRAELLSGLSFGTHDQSVQARIGSTACQVTQWRAGTSVRCRISPGISTQLQVVLTAGSGHVTGSRSVSFTFDLQTIVESLPYANFPRIGVQIFTMIGAEYGDTDYTMSPRVGYTLCEASIWLSDSSLACKIASGISTGLAITLALLDVPTIGPRIYTSGRFWSYNAPSINVIESPHNTPRFSTEFDIYGEIWSNFSQRSIIMNGTSFGKWDSSLTIRHGGSSSEASVWMSDSSLVCRAASGTAIPQQEFASCLTVARTVSSLTQAFSLDTPSIHSILPPNTPGTGGVSISIFGSNFGAFDSSLIVAIGSYTCRETRWVSDSALITLSAPGAYGKFLTVDIVSWGPGHAPKIFLDSSRFGEITLAVSYNLPVVRHIYPAAAAPHQRDHIQVVMRIDGQNFGGNNETRIIPLNPNLNTCRALTLTQPYTHRRTRMKNIHRT